MDNGVMKIRKKKTVETKSNECKKLTAVDLFCGCGSLTVGLKKAGFRLIGAVDIDSLSVETYRANHKDVTVWENDSRKMEPSELITIFCQKM